MNDDRISRYLADQAEGITLPPADPEGVIRRGARRRTRRRSALVGSLAVVAVLATAVALRDGSDDQRVEQGFLAPEVVPSPFEWSTVSPETGLAWSSSSVQLDGVVYSLSTAPAAETDPSRGDVGPPSLYRSDDGAEWARVTAPDGVRVSSLAGAGDTLYALGTAPAGGGTRDLVLSTSTDGASTWSNITLPRDLAEIEARHPGQVFVNTPRVVARDATHLVANVGVSANLDPSQYFPEMNEGDRAYSSEWTADGLVVRDMGEIPCEAVGPRGDANEPSDKVCMAEARRAIAEDEGEVVFQKTYDELGIDQELRGLIGGRSLTYVSEDGATFERVDVPLGAGEWTSDLLATADGYRMARGSREGNTATLLRSADGRTWTVDTTLPGSPGELGLLGDRVAVSLYDDTGNHVRVQQPDGQWSDLDLTGAVSAPAGMQAWMSDVAFGPLGLATVIGTSDDEGRSGESYIVHTTDGTTVSAVPVSDVVDDVDGVSVVGATVTADAIAVRFTVPQDDDPATPPTQIVLVGTPTG